MVGLNDISSHVSYNLSSRKWVSEYGLRGRLYIHNLSISTVTLTTNLQSGLNARIHMPACWDGKVSYLIFLDGLDFTKQTHRTSTPLTICHTSRISRVWIMESAPQLTLSPSWNYSMKWTHILSWHFNIQAYISRQITWDVHAFVLRWRPGTDAWPFVYGISHPLDKLLKYSFLTRSDWASDPPEHPT